METTELDDKAIIEKLRDPERQNYGFSLLIYKYQEKVYSHIRRMVINHDDADDLVQDTFVRIFKNFHKFREESRLYTWIYKIATNECLSFLEKKKKRFFLPIHDYSKELENHLTSSHLVDGDEIQLKFHKALLKLPTKQRSVFNMKYFDELKYEEIADITGTSVGALKASYHHATKKIEEYLGAD